MKLEEAKDRAKTEICELIEGIDADWDEKQNACETALGIISSLCYAYEGQPEQKWVSVKERLPEVAGYYLTWLPTRKGGKSWILQFDAANKWDGLNETEHITHWMPLPAAPQEAI